jgi:hypothetical protein
MSVVKTTMVWCSLIFLFLVTFVFSEAPTDSSDLISSSTFSTTHQENVTISPYNSTRELQRGLEDFNLSRSVGRDHDYGCHVHVFEKTFTHPDCIRQNVKIRGCRGQCMSFSSPWSSRNGHFIVRNSCHCCQASETRKGVVYLNCPRDQGSKKRAVRIKGAMKCRCRKC